MVKISGDFSTITHEFAVEVRINEVCEDSFTTKKEQGENKEEYPANLMSIMTHWRMPYSRATT